MNYLEFIKLNGICKTQAGHKIHDLKINDCLSSYPLSGKIEWKNGLLTDMVWTTDGLPYNLPLNNGLGLIAVVPKIEFTSLDISNINEKEYNEMVKNK